MLQKSAVFATLCSQMVAWQRETKASVLHNHFLPFCLIQKGVIRKTTLQLSNDFETKKIIDFQPSIEWPLGGAVFRFFCHPSTSSIIWIMMLRYRVRKLAGNENFGKLLLWIRVEGAYASFLFCLVTTTNITVFTTVCKASRTFQRYQCIKTGFNQFVFK